MRLSACCLFLIGLAGVAGAQAPATRNLGLVGDRFKPLEYEHMTPEQKTMVDHLLSGERRGLPGPFNVMLRSPEMGDLAQQLGANVRFHSELPKNVHELVIIMTARYWTAQVEWSAHKRAALQAGVNPDVVDAIANGRRPASMLPEEEAAYKFCSELLNTKQVTDATFDDAKVRFGEKGVVNMIALSGYYQLVSMMLDVDRTPLAGPAKPELKPLAKSLP